MHRTTGSENVGRPFTLTELHTLLESYEIVDLSLQLDEDLHCSWPGHVLFLHRVHNWYVPIDDAVQPMRSLAPYYTCWTMLDEHAGTHFDAPPHFIPPTGSGLEAEGPVGVEYGDTVPLGDLQGRAAVIDVRYLCEGFVESGVSPRIDVECLQEWERVEGEFSPGEIVLLQTGWDKHYVRGPDGNAYSQRAVVNRTHPGWPAPSPEAVVYLNKRHIKTLGTDAPSIGAADEGISMHRAGLSRGMRYVEGLTALDRLPTRGAYFVFMPLKVARSSGGNGRALAYIPKTLSGREPTPRRVRTSSV